jgi:hypothetical protein
MGTCRRTHAHKFTAKCPKCNYTSRIPETSFHLDNSNSVHSKTCPKHRLELVRVIHELKNTKAGRLKKWNDQRLYGK